MIKNENAAIPGIGHIEPVVGIGSDVAGRAQLIRATAGGRGVKVFLPEDDGSGLAAGEGF